MQKRWIRAAKGNRPPKLLDAKKAARLVELGAYVYVEPEQPAAAPEPVKRSRPARKAAAPVVVEAPPEAPPEEPAPVEVAGAGAEAEAEAPPVEDAVQADPGDVTEEAPRRRRYTRRDMTAED